MDEKCEVHQKDGSRVSDPYSKIPPVSDFCKRPPFRSGLEQNPTDKQWERLIWGAQIQGDCLIHPKERISFKSVKYQTRRLFFELFLGRAGAEQEIRTTCKNINCVYPLHLKIHERPSHSDKVYQMWKRREEDKELTRKQKAEKYDVPLWVVRNHLTGKSYKHLPVGQVDEKTQKIIDPPKEIIIFSISPEKMLEEAQKVKPTISNLSLQ